MKMEKLIMDLVFESNLRNKAIGPHCDKCDNSITVRLDKLE